MNAAGDTIPKIAGIISPLAYEPELATARALVGDESISGGYTAPDPAAVRRRHTVTVTHGRFTADDTTYTMREAGSYSFGRFTRGKATWGVLWDDARRLVWVDTDGDRDFGDETPLTDVNTRFAAGYLTPLDSTRAQPPQRVSFAVQFDSITDRVRLHVGIEELVSGRNASPAARLRAQLRDARR